MNQFFFSSLNIEFLKNANIFKIRFCIDIVGVGRDLFSFDSTIIFIE